jgi:hypothetical protein
MPQFLLRSKSLIVVSLLAIGAMLFATRHGIGLLPFDSISYLCTARNILSGYGFFQNDFFDFGRTAMTHFPPLYPATIALVSAFGIDPTSSARLLNSFLFGANIFCIGIAVRTITSSWKAELFVAILAMMSQGMLNYHCRAVSEPLFLFFFLLSVIMLSRYILSQKSIMLALSSVLLSFSFCTRYSGLALVVTEIACILFLCKTRLKQRIIDSAGMALISTAPVFLWIIRNLLISGNPADRNFLFYPVAPQDLREGLFNIARWIFPGHRLHLVTLPFLSVCFLVLAALLLRSSKTACPRKTSLLHLTVRTLAPDVLSKALLLFSSIYLLFLLFSISTFDHDTTLNVRILLPVFVSFLILGAGFCARTLSGQWKPRAARILFLLCTAVVVSSYLLTGARWLITDKNQSDYFFIKPWESSEIVSAVRKLPPGSMIYSNIPFVFWLVTDKQACLVPWFLSAPEKIDLGPDSLEVEKILASRRGAMRTRLQGRTAVVALLDTLFFGISQEELSRDSILGIYHLAPVVVCAEGTLYQGGLFGAFSRNR